MGESMMQSRVIFDPDVQHPQDGAKLFLETSGGALIVMSISAEHGPKRIGVLETNQEAYGHIYIGGGYNAYLQGDSVEIELTPAHVKM